MGFNSVFKWSQTDIISSLGKAVGQSEVSGGQLWQQSDTLDCSLVLASLISPFGLVL
jgi:hypothetical protein